MKNMNKVWNKFCKDTLKSVKKIKCNEAEFYNSYFNFNSIVTLIDHTDISMITMSNILYKKIKREELVKTLIDINNKRNNDKWTPSVIIAFMTEALLFSQADSFYKTQPNNIGNSLLQIHFPNKEEEYYEQCLQELCERYNVPKNRINTQIALFIMNLQKGNDKADLLSYFDYYELLLWKYRDLEKLQNDIENNKISDSDLMYLKKYNIIE